ncbi:hypothetical protein B0H11DRAFT_2427857 [Mycena galericulata]|nr:hypothetical protein B0H11DRAFT_2427857 [Mycena galericulata]
MVSLPIRARRSFYTYTGRIPDRGPLFRTLRSSTPISRPPISRTAILLVATFALSLASVIYASTRFLSSSSRIRFQLEEWSYSVYDPFTRPSAADAIADTRIRPIKAHLQIPDACLDQWVASGRWQGSCIRVPVEEPPIDLVYIWVNGSDVLHSESREDLLGVLNYSTRNARFRQHDELRYSLRSAFKNTRPWKDSVWHIVTADVPDPDEFEDSQRLGLVPQWLDLDSAWAGGENGEPPVYLHHDSELFRLTTLPGYTPSIEEVDKWRDSVLPTFNSMAVESQLPHLDPNIVSDNILYLNDDQFFVLPLPPSAFHSALSGEADGGGEWRSLGWSAHILNQRFGTRRRAYVQHNARALTLPLMHEATLTFGDYFALTPKSQFRGSHGVSGEFEVNMIFTVSHFVMERHREALLWSWVVAKWGRRRRRPTSEYDQPDKQQRRGSQYAGCRARSNRSLTNQSSGRIPPIFLFPTTGSVQITWRGLTILLYGGNDCIGENKETAWAVFRRLAVEKTHCGDAVITALTDTSRRGLSIFLPPHTSSVPISSPAVLPLIMPATPPPLPENPRAFAVRLIHRYAYAIGETPSAFFGVQSADQGRAYFSWLQADVALLCVNDDLYDDALNVTRGDVMLRKWFQNKWPTPLSFER